MMERHDTSVVLGAGGHVIEALVALAGGHEAHRRLEIGEVHARELLAGSGPETLLEARERGEEWRRNEVRDEGEVLHLAQAEPRQNADLHNSR